MSILQEYERIRNNLKPGEFQAMEKWLELNPKYFLSDIYYQEKVNQIFHDWWKKIREK